MKLEPQWYDGTEPRPTVLQPHQYGAVARISTAWGGLALVLSLICGYAAHHHVASRGGPFLAAAVALLSLGTVAIWIGKQIPRYVLERGGVLRFRYPFEVVDIPLRRLTVVRRLVVKGGPMWTINRAVILIVVREHSEKRSRWLLLNGELDPSSGISKGLNAYDYVTALDRLRAPKRTD